MLVTTGAGFSVGLIRYLIKFPREMAGLFKEIEEMHVDYYYILPIYALSMISLSGGATLGPEQALVSATLSPFFRFDLSLYVLLLLLLLPSRSTWVEVLPRW